MVHTPWAQWGRGSRGADWASPVGFATEPQPSQQGLHYVAFEKSVKNNLKSACFDPISCLTPLEKIAYSLGKSACSRFNLFRTLFLFSSLHSSFVDRSPPPLPWLVHPRGSKTIAPPTLAAWEVLYPPGLRGLIPPYLDGSWDPLAWAVLHPSPWLEGTDIPPTGKASPHLAWAVLHPPLARGVWYPPGLSGCTPPPPPRGVLYPLA